MAGDSKVKTIIPHMQAPPPYISNGPTRTEAAPTLSTLPAHILLHIIYLTFPQKSLPDASRLARQRKTLYWLSVALRLVDRTFYTACMHILRSTHIPGYDALVRPPYTSDPFPLLAPPPASSRSGILSPYASIPQASSTQTKESPLNTIQRETAVLDQFIALKLHEDVWSDESELHLERDEAYKDLFDHAQPRARLHDLVRIYGVERGIICVGDPPLPSKNVPTPPIPISTLSITLAPRSAGIVLSRRTIVSTPRTREETLESVARRLVGALKGWVEDRVAR